MGNLDRLYALIQANEGHYFDAEGILRGPKAVWKPIPENSTQPTITPWSVILHANAGQVGATSWNLWSWVNRKEVTGEPHFNVDTSGTMLQMMSVLRRADCNAAANLWMRTLPNGTRIPVGAISIETGDNGAATLDTTPWTVDQLDRIVIISTAANIQYNTGCNEVLSWDGHGIDYHTKFPYIGIGKKAWSIYSGKTCPGKARKLQTPYIRHQVALRTLDFIEKCRELGVPHGIPGIA